MHLKFKNVARSVIPPATRGVEAKHAFLNLILHIYFRKRSWGSL